MSKRIFGDIEGFPVGAFFPTRGGLSATGVHRPPQAGISGSGKEGADSIVLSGGYEDDQDDGDMIIYTGHGGRDQTTGKQTSDQLLERGNLALAYSCLHGLPVRVIRGSTHRSPLAPPTGYRYDGLYRVEDYWHTKGKSGHTIWRFRLTKIATASSRSRLIAETPESYEPAQRQPTMIVRIIRDTQQAHQVKELYDYHCQVCGIRLESSAGPYAEAAHIRPLGSPHNGPDTLENLLCLCPNHHVLFDYGGFTIDDDFTLLGIFGQLTVKAEHQISRTHLRYHRTHYYNRI
jgi:putative restriction endonuclease